MMQRRLKDYDSQRYAPGRGITVRALWYFLSLMFFETGWLPFSFFKCLVLRLFGADLGQGVVIKPNVRIKFPWRLSIGDHSWIGQDVWIDNLDQVTIKANCCVSQGAYLCTGSHDHKSPTFELVTGPIIINSGAWLAAKCIILPGAIVETNTIVPAGAIIKRHSSVKLTGYISGDDCKCSTE